jgi:hypothetical protein
VVLGGSYLLLVPNGAVMVMFASSHLLLVSNGAIIGGAREFTSVVSN